MKLQVAKWGNSLAVRLPAECVRQANLREGDIVEAEVTPAGEVVLAAARSFDKMAFLARLRKLHARLPLTEPVAEKMRRADRY